MAHLLRQGDDCARAFANAAPNLGVDAPALTELAGAGRMPVAGKDQKTGHTLFKRR